jgi:hypothetical protein
MKWKDVQKAKEFSKPMEKNEILHPQYNFLQVFAKATSSHLKKQPKTLNAEMDKCYSCLFMKYGPALPPPSLTLNELLQCNPWPNWKIAVAEVKVEYENEGLISKGDALYCLRLYLNSSISVFLLLNHYKDVKLDSTATVTWFEDFLTDCEGGNTLHDYHFEVMNKREVIEQLKFDVMKKYELDMTDIRSANIIGNPTVLAHKYIFQKLLTIKF